jgi:hypothetical protein
LHLNEIRGALIDIAQQLSWMRRQEEEEEVRYIEALWQSLVVGNRGSFAIVARQWDVANN